MVTTRNNMVLCGVLMMSACGTALGTITYLSGSGSGWASWDEGWSGYAGKSFSWDPAAPREYFGLVASPSSPFGPGIFTYSESRQFTWMRHDRLYTRGGASAANTPQLFTRAHAEVRLDVMFSTDIAVIFEIATSNPVWPNESAMASLIGSGGEMLNASTSVGNRQWAGVLLPGTYELHLSLGADASPGDAITDGNSRHDSYQWFTASIPAPGGVALALLGGAALSRRRRGWGS